MYLYNSQSFLCEVDDLGISDYSLCFMYILECVNTKPKDMTLLKKNYIVMLRNCFFSMDWSKLYNIKDINNAFIKFSCLISDKKTLKPWISLGLIKGYLKKMLYIKKYLQSYNTKLANYYKRYKNKLIRDFRKAKKKYYFKLFGRKTQGISGI